MALKGDRKYTIGTNIKNFMNETAEKGEIVIYLPNGGSGASLDDANATVGTPTAADASGLKPAGLLLNDVVNLDLTRQHINWHKDEVQLGGKVTLLRQGEATTNVVDTGVSPTAGDPAYFGRGALVTGGTVQGWLTTTEVTDSLNGDAQYRVGTFQSQKDADGFVSIEVNL